jgi:uncharacterized protein (TIGR00255 family)
VIQSMTGFGSATFQASDSGFEVEVRSVNHRHLDARVRLPRNFSSLESDLRARIQARFDRGKIDCSVIAPEASTPEPRLEVDREAAREYLRAAREISSQEQLDGEVGVAQLLGLPGVTRFVEPKVSLEALGDAAGAALEKALDGLAAMRAAEGAALERDLKERLDRVGELADALEARAGLVQEAVRERLHRRVRQLGAETGLVDETRLHQEVTLAADRLDVTEEIVRLRSHVEQFRQAIESAGPGAPVGRRLEFLLQELSREANTIGSKGADAPIAHLIVDLKTELERVREQVQNVE